MGDEFAMRLERIGPEVRLRESLRQLIRRTTGMAVYEPKIMGAQRKHIGDLKQVIEHPTPGTVMMVDPVTRKHLFMLGKDDFGDAKAVFG